VDAPNKTQLELGPIGVYAQIPEIAAAYATFTATLRTKGALPRRLVELVRLRVAFHNQCRSCMAVRYRDTAGEEVDETLVCQLSDHQIAGDLTDAEKAALNFADKFANEHLSIDDAVIESLKSFFTEAEIIELGMNVALCVGFGRLAASLDLVDHLPQEYVVRDQGPIAPWSGKPVII
jgi:alkylhydroperoxidase family enzyme